MEMAASQVPVSFVAVTQATSKACSAGMAAVTTTIAMAAASSAMAVTLVEGVALLPGRLEVTRKVPGAVGKLVMFTEQVATYVGNEEVGAVRGLNG